MAIGITRFCPNDRSFVQLICARPLSNHLLIRQENSDIVFPPISAKKAEMDGARKSTANVKMVESIHAGSFISAYLDSNLNLAFHSVLSSQTR